MEFHFEHVLEDWTFSMNVNLANNKNKKEYLCSYFIMFIWGGSYAAFLTIGDCLNWGEDVILCTLWIL